MKTPTQMLRQYPVTDGTTKIHESSINLLQEIERNQLLLAYYAGQRSELTFDQWYEATFKTETK